MLTCTMAIKWLWLLLLQIAGEISCLG